MARRPALRARHAATAVRRQRPHAPLLSRREAVAAAHETTIRPRRPHHQRPLCRLVRAARERETHTQRRPVAHHRRHPHLIGLLLSPVRADETVGRGAVAQRRRPVLRPRGSHHAQSLQRPVPDRETRHEHRARTPALPRQHLLRQQHRDGQPAALCLRHDRRRLRARRGGEKHHRQPGDKERRHRVVRCHRHRMAHAHAHRHGAHRHRLAAGHQQKIPVVGLHGRTWRHHHLGTVERRHRQSADELGQPRDAAGRPAVMDLRRPGRHPLRRRLQAHHARSRLQC